MTASDLREWVALFLMDSFPDGAGGERTSIPAGLAPNLPANIRTPSPREIMAGDQLSDRVAVFVTIRYQPGITSNYRVLWRDQYYDVTAVKNVDNADTWIELACERKEAGSQ
jgi:head-tail adaptor